MRILVFRGALKKVLKNNPYHRTCNGADDIDPCGAKITLNEIRGYGANRIHRCPTHGGGPKPR